MLFLFSTLPTMCGWEFFICTKHEKSFIDGGWESTYTHHGIPTQQTIPTHHLWAMGDTGTHDSPVPQWEYKNRFEGKNTSYKSKQRCGHRNQQQPHITFNEHGEKRQHFLVPGTLLPTLLSDSVHWILTMTPRNEEPQTRHTQGPTPKVFAQKISLRSWYCNKGIIHDKTCFFL